MYFTVTWAANLHSVFLLLAIHKLVSFVDCSQCHRFASFSTQLESRLNENEPMNDTPKSHPPQVSP
ncbi:hypothetical protein TCAL_15144 [Tigriopus californicus]|uniref:Uncharacterized protein n=1 Tax=Tigriopus californicus TaxID=6832 RepID=A0A553NTX4_TIGCA|nr:hypothetical protein TCAL_15144 [Tigriopus californicus]